MPWYISQDTENWQAPQPSREWAISEGRSYYSDEAFYVAEFDTQDYDLSMKGDDIVERLRDLNEDLMGEDSTFLTEDPIKLSALSALVSKAIYQWASEHQVPITAWALLPLGKEELIEPEDSTPNECP
jgi:hypothetical protein